MIRVGFLIVSFVSFGLACSAQNRKVMRQFELLPSRYDTDSMRVEFNYDSLIFGVDRIANNMLEITSDSLNSSSMLTITSQSYFLSSIDIQQTKKRNSLTNEPSFSEFVERLLKAEGIDTSINEIYINFDRKLVIVTFPGDDIVGLSEIIYLFRDNKVFGLVTTYQIYEFTTVAQNILKEFLCSINLVNE